MKTIALLVTAVLSLTAPGWVLAEDQPADSNRIVPPSEYLEDIETPGSTGGVDEEADAADAQAEEAAEEAGKRKLADPQGE